MAEKSELDENSKSKDVVLKGMVSVLKEKINQDTEKGTVTVSTKEELEKAVNDSVEKIIITGDLASEIIKAQKKQALAKKAGIGSVILAGLSVAGGIALAPFTGGASAVAGVASALTITAGSTVIVLTTVEVIAVLAGVLGALGIAVSVINIIAKNYDVHVSINPPEVTCKRKAIRT